ncbi:MAG: O-antigen flippase [Gammaproteobacteria bacterium]|nr:MAG: O-antigen flippase [Gammaproteobacteria bacterium]
MTLIKTSFLNAISVVIKMLTMLGINKILAVYVGPSGYALIGQLQNAVAMLLTFSSGAINTGVTKYTAQYSEFEDKQHSVWRASFRITLISVLIISFFIFIFSDFLSVYFLKNIEYSIVFTCFSFTLVFFALNAQVLAILNGKKEIYAYVQVNIIGSLVSLVVTVSLAFLYGLKGALIALVINQSVVFFVSVFIASKFDWFKAFNFSGVFDKKIALNLLKYALMGLTGAIVVPLSHIFIRTHIGEQFGWESAGYWDAIWRISTIYLMFITSVLSVYFLPRFSEIKIKKELRAELLKGYSLIIPTVLFLSLCIYLARDYIVVLLFSNDFLAMRNLFLWQLVGDVFKVISWLLGYILLAKAMVKLVIFSELLFALSFYLFTVFFTSYFGLEGVTYAYCLNYFCHLGFMFFSLKRLRVL